MQNMERSKKRVHLWKKAIFHFLLCFVMGFFTGFAPTGNFKSNMLQMRTPITNNLDTPPDNSSSSANRSLSETPNTTETPKTSETPNNTVEDVNSFEESESNEEHDPSQRKQIIVITPTSDKDPVRGVLLNRMANTLKLVPPPLLWIVVESQLESSNVSDILRRTGVMYRHLVFKENFTNPRAETDHQQNLALKHIEHHRLSGIVHFAGLSNVYDLNFFNEIRAIETFGTWPLAKLSTKRKKMIIEGPVCQSSQVVGWHINSNMEAEQLAIHISSFGFNSSILWDPERWVRLPAGETTKQNTLKFVKQAVVEDESKIKGLPSEDCSKVNIWQFHLPSKFIHLGDPTINGEQR